MTTYKILVGGRVQGVGYRNYIFRTAMELNINGYVKNLEGGEVQIMAEAKKDVLENFLDYCKKGSDRSEVKSVDYEEISSLELNNFEIQI